MIKRGLAFFLTAIIFLMPLVTVSASSAEETEYHFSVGIYNAVAKEYILNNKTLTASQGLCIQNTIDLLKREGLISDFIQNEENLESITYISNNEEKVIKINGDSKFYVKLNGILVSDSALDQTIAEGDIIEWIFTTNQEFKKAQKLESVSDQAAPARASIGFWTDEMSKIMDDACSWLNLNSDMSQSYLIAIGSAGKTANIDVVNSLLAKVDQTDNYTSPCEIAQYIMKMAYCGYDIENSKIKELLTNLMTFKDITADGAVGLADTLLAYDCRKYKVPDDVLNNRRFVMDNLLEMQTSSGSFSDEKNMNDIEETSLAVIALSGYMDDITVKTAVDKAVAYLTSQKSYVSSKNISNVIISLSSIGVFLNENSFYKQGETFVNLLLQYQNNDGGFSDVLNGQSDTASTERAIIALSAIKKNENPFRISGPVDAAFILSNKTIPQNNKTTPHNKAFSYIGLVLICVSIFVYLIKIIYKKSHGKKLS